MHVAIIANPFVSVPPKKYGGTERVIYYLIKGLIEAGHQVTLFASADSKVDCELIPIVQKQLFFGKDKNSQDQIIKKTFEIEKFTNQLIRENINRFDILHSHGFDLIEFQNFPNLTTLHGMFTLQDMAYYEKRKGLNYVSISKNQQAPFQELEYVTVAYNGLDPKEFVFVQHPEDYLCFLGRLDPEKNPHQAIELALQLGKKIKVAGKIDHLGSIYFKEKVEPLLKNDLVEYLGEIGMQEKQHLLAHAKLNLHPTNFREPFGLTIIEAAYCGTPTLAINKGSMAELIEDGRTGILVEDFIEAFHKVEECFSLDRQYVSSRARMLFNYRNMTKDYIAAYQQVIQQNQ